MINMDRTLRYVNENENGSLSWDGYGFAKLEINQDVCIHSRSSEALNWGELYLVLVFFYAIPW